MAPASYSAGIVARYPTDEGVTPFGACFGGAVRLGGPNYAAIYHVYTGDRR